MIYLRRFNSRGAALVRARSELNTFLREWFKAMAVWLARWVKEHEMESIGKEQS